MLYVLVPLPAGWRWRLQEGILHMNIHWTVQPGYRYCQVGQLTIFHQAGPIQSLSVMITLIYVRRKYWWQSIVLIRRSKRHLISMKRPVRVAMARLRSLLRQVEADRAMSTRWMEEHLAQAHSSILMVVLIRWRSATTLAVQKTLLLMWRSRVLLIIM